MTVDHLFGRRSPTSLCLELTECLWANPVAPGPPSPRDSKAVTWLPRSCQPWSLSIQKWGRGSSIPRSPLTEGRGDGGVCVRGDRSPGPDEVDQDEEEPVVRNEGGSKLGEPDPSPGQGPGLLLEPHQPPPFQSLGAWGSPHGLCPTLTRPMTQTGT